MNPIPHLSALRRYARSLTHDRAAADDLVQSTALRALEKAHLYRVDSNPRAWLMTIMHNLHIRDLRAASRQVQVIDDPANSSSPDAALLVRDVVRALAAMPPTQRAAVLYFARHDHSYDVAAKALAVPRGTIASRLARGRAELRRRLEVPDG